MSELKTTEKLVAGGLKEVWLGRRQKNNVKRWLKKANIIDDVDNVIHQTIYIFPGEDKGWRVFKLYSLRKGGLNGDYLDGDKENNILIPYKGITGLGRMKRKEGWDIEYDD